MNYNLNQFEGYCKTITLYFQKKYLLNNIMNAMNIVKMKFIATTDSGGLCNYPAVR